MPFFSAGYRDKRFFFVGSRDVKFRRDAGYCSVSDGISGFTGFFWRDNGSCKFSEIRYYVLVMRDSVTTDLAYLIPVLLVFFLTGWRRENSLTGSRDLRVF